MAKSFTPDEIAVLKNNPYTSFASERMLTFTREFKEDFLTLYRQGYPPRKILPMLGYNVDMIGKARLNGICQQIRLQETSEKGLRAGRNGKTTAPARLAEVTTIVSDHQLLMELKKEVEVLRSEINILKNNV